MNQMHIGGIGLDTSSGEPIVVLQDTDKIRAIPIWIGEPEARAITIGIGKVRAARPLTHTLMLDAISSLGYMVKNIAIDRLEGSVFKATITLRPRKEKSKKPLIQLDSRPSDAIALAAITDIPILVSSEIYTQASVPTDPDFDEKERRAFKEFLDKVMASDFNSMAPLDEDGESGG